MIALYAAPRARLGLEGQASVGAGSISGDLLGNKSKLIDAEALRSEVGSVPEGVYDVYFALAVEGAEGGNYTERDVRSVFLSGSAEQRAATVARAWQTAAREKIAANSSQLVLLVESIMVPAGTDVPGIELGKGPPLEPPPPSRSERARSQLRDSRGRFVPQNPQKRRADPAPAPAPGPRLVDDDAELFAELERAMSRAIQARQQPRDKLGRFKKKRRRRA